jgi:hypothetical protein
MYALDLYFLLLSERGRRLTIGGGPGTSGMLNPMSAQGPCLAVENGTVPNPNRWTGEPSVQNIFRDILSLLVEHFNLIALDHVCLFPVA